MPVNLSSHGRFGRYELVRRLAVGGMAEVFKAKQFSDNAFHKDGFYKVVALKRILPGALERERFVDMFVQEARIAARLDHPNIGRLYELGCELDGALGTIPAVGANPAVDPATGRLYLTMEFIYGHDLREVLKRLRARGEAMDSWVLARLGAAIASALDHAWNREGEDGEPLRLVHRDVSPQNIMVGFDGVPKLIDFGIAKVQNASVQTAAGVLKGKYAYMSPEHARAKPLDCRADIWSLGVVLYELLTGRRLFAGATVGETVEAILTFQIPSLETDPPGLGQIVAKMLSRDPDARFATHDGVRRALAAIADSAPGGHEATSPEAIAAWMERLFPDTPSFESDLTEADVRLVMSAEERGEETTDVHSDVGSATRIFLADSTGQAEYRAVLAALLSRGKLEPREEDHAADAPTGNDAQAATPAPPGAGAAAFLLGLGLALGLLFMFAFR